MNINMFAWFPVYCEDTGYCWLTTVYRHEHTDFTFYSKSKLILIRNNK